MVTIEEAGRGWIGIVCRRLKKKKSKKEIFDLNHYQADDPLLQTQLDAFKSALLKDDKPSTFQPEQIEMYKKEIYKEKRCSYLERIKLGKIIDEIFEDLNSYISSQMTLGEKALLLQGEKTQQMIREVQQGALHTQSEGLEYGRLLTVVPPRVPVAYAYREKEVEELLDLLLQYSNLAIQGIGGIGKTTIARDLFYRLEEQDYYLAWLEYSGSLKDDMMSALNIYELQDDKGNEQRLYKFLLQHKGKVIFFVDNADERMWKDSYFDRLSGAVRFILITRMMDVRDLFYTYKIEALSEKNACNVFWNYYGVKDEYSEESVKQLVREVRCHTLMIEMTAKTAKWAECSLEEYIQKLLVQGYGVSGDVIVTSHNVVEDTISRHLIHLYNMQKMSDTEKYILKNFAVAPDEVQPFEFRKWIARREDGSDALKLDFQNLCRKGWIAQVDMGYEMHPVIREAILLQDKPRFADIKPLLLRVLDEEEDFFDGNLDYENMCGRIRLVDSLITHFPPQQQEAVQTVITVLVLVCKDYCLFDKARYYADLDLNLNMRRYGLYHKYTEESLYNKAHVLGALQEYEEAIKCCKQLLEVSDYLCEDKNHIHFYYAYRLYGTLLAENKQYGEAVMMLERALSIQNPSINEKDQAVIEFNLLSILLEIRDYKRAEWILEKRETFFCSLYGEEHINMATLYQNKANIYAYNNDFEHALEYDCKALAIRQKKLGDEHVDTAQSYYAVAEDKVMLDSNTTEELDEILAYVQKAYGTWKRLLGEQNAYTCMAKKLLDNLRKNL